MENPIIVPFDLNTARKIKSGEIEGSVLIGNIKIEFVYESKDCADRYNLLFVKKDESGISAIYADTEGRTFFNNVLELEVEAGAYNCLTMIAVKNPEVRHITNVNVMRCLTLTDAAIRNALWPEIQS